MIEMGESLAFQDVLLSQDWEVGKRKEGKTNQRLFCKHPNKAEHVGEIAAALCSSSLMCPVSPTFKKNVGTSRSFGSCPCSLYWWFCSLLKSCNRVEMEGALFCLVLSSLVVCNLTCLLEPSAQPLHNLLQVALLTHQ